MHTNNTFSLFNFTIFIYCIYKLYYVYINIMTNLQYLHTFLRNHHIVLNVFISLVVWKLLLLLMKMHRLSGSSIKYFMIYYVNCVIKLI